MFPRVHVFTLLLMLGLAPCYAGKPGVRDGSTKDKAIPLKERGAKAVEEEMAWMMKLYHYTPVLTNRDAMIEVVRKVKAGQKGFEASLNWEHGTLEHGNQWCSYWSFLTPQGRRKIYFDTGVAISTPGEVPRQERARAQYMARATDSLKLQ